jgi:hypothetical protein
MADLGDLSNFLKEGSVANLDWLDVDEKEYQKESVLPKQNLDIAPDLQALWAHEDDPSTNHLVPNTGPVKPFPGAGEVHTMGDLSMAHGPLRAKAEDVAKVTRYALIQSSDLNALRRTLTAKFDAQTLQANRDVIAQALQERGLLGRVYIVASDFPSCHNSPKTPQLFVRRHASDAKYIVAKPQCNNCIHAKKIGSTTNCAVFHKEVVLNVPYTEQLAAEVEQLQRMQGKVIQASTAAPKERIRLAVLAETPKREAVYRGVGENQFPKPVGGSTEGLSDQLVAASNLTRKRDEKMALDHKATPIVAFIRREMLKGRTSAEVGESLRVRFSMDDLARTRSVWEPHFREAGLYGRVYSTQDSFDDCHEGADFVAKHNLGIRGIVTGSKCESCIYNKIGRCMLYGKPLIREASDLYTPQTVNAVILELRTAGRLPPVDGRVASSWGNTPREQLKGIYQSVAREAPPVQASGRLDIVRAFHGAPAREPQRPVVRPIVAAARKYLNEGLYGEDLVRTMRLAFSAEEIQAARGELKAVFAEQGLQGIYYIDPAPYSDYGAGCEEVSRLYKSKQVKYAKIGPKCTGCVHNVNNTCSKLGKALVHEPPYVDKTAQQHAMLNSGAATETNLPSLMQGTGLSMVAEYQLQNGGMTVEVDEAKPATSFEIVMGRAKVKV